MHQNSLKRISIHNETINQTWLIFSSLLYRYFVFKTREFERIFKFHADSDYVDSLMNLDIAPEVLGGCFEDFGMHGGYTAFEIVSSQVSVGIWRP